MEQVNTDKAQLYERLIKQGASPKQATTYTGYAPPEAKPKVDRATVRSTVDNSGKAIKGVGSLVSSSKAQKVIFGIMVTVTFLTILGDIFSGTSKGFDVIPRRMVAGSIAGIMLMLLAIPLPKVTMYLAITIGLSALLFNPQNVSIINRIVAVGGGTPDKSDQPQQTRERKPQ
jgi:hypothetical protein